MTGQEGLEIELRAMLIAVRGTAPPPRSERSTQILQAAYDVIAREGFERFTLRRVAERVAISLASLQYHFASRERLISELIEFRLDGYADAIFAKVRELPDDPRRDFLEIVDWFLRDALDRTVSGFAFHFYAMAASDAAVNAALGRYMKVYRETIAVLARRLRPELSRGEALARAALICSLVDGTMTQLSDGRAPFPELEGVADRVGAAALAIVHANRELTDGDGVSV